MKIENAICRFWTKVRIGDSKHCWPWLGCVDCDGYGFLYLSWKKTRAHRFSLSVSGVEVREDQVVMHECDNPPCCNPAHLRVGSIVDNRMDCVTKGRHAVGDRNGARTRPETRAFGARNGTHLHPETVVHGVEHPKAKLTEQSVTEIRRLNAAGVSQLELADRFGVRQCTISSAVRRETWKHVK